MKRLLHAIRMALFGDPAAEARRFHGERIAARQAANTPWQPAPTVRPPRSSGAADCHRLTSHQRTGGCAFERGGPS